MHKSILNYNFIMSKKRKSNKQTRNSDKTKVYSIYTTKETEKIFIIFLMSVIACVISWASLRFLPDIFHLGALCIVGVFTLLIGAMTLFMARKLYLYYKKDSTIL